MVDSRRINSNRLFIIVVIISVLLRVASALYFGDRVIVLPGTADQVSYHTLARRVLEGHGFTFGYTWWPLTAPNAPTAHWSFLYTFYLVAVYALFGPHPLAARLIQAVIVGVFHPYFTYRIGSRVFGQPAGLIAAGITAIYVYFFYYSATLMTEPFYITAILWTLDTALRIDEATPGQVGRWLELGLAMGVTALLRQLFLLIVPFVFLWLWWRNRYWRGERGDVRRLGREMLSGTLLALGVVCALIAPFTIYNYIRFDSFVLLNTNSGYAFFWANHPIYGTHFEPILPPEMGSYRALIPSELRGLDEAALGRALLGRGIQFVLDDPVRYFFLSLSRVPIYFQFWPSPTSSAVSNVSRVGSFGLFLPFMVYGLIDALRHHYSRSMILLVLFIIVYTMIHLLSWTLIRYRLPVDAVAVVFAALPLARLGKRWGDF